MFKPEIEEAEPIVNVAVDALLRWAPTRGRPGSDLRRACGDIKGHCKKYLHDDTLGPPLALAFELARTTGITFAQMNNVRTAVAAQGAFTVGAIVVRDACLELALAEMGHILAATTFVSKSDVDKVRTDVNLAFAAVEEETADQMDSMSYRALIGLHAAITSYLIERARPLPQMLYFRFGQAAPTLVFAYKLYADAGRGDELRKENKVIHPAFQLPAGVALSH